MKMRVNDFSIILSDQITNEFIAVEDMIKEVDVDGDGKIDFYEFVHALGEPEDSQDNDEDDDIINSPLPTPKSNVPSFSDISSQWFL